HIYKKKMKPKQVPLDKELKKIKLREPIKTISGISTKEMAERWEAYYPSVAKKEAAAKKKQKETLAKKRSEERREGKECKYTRSKRDWSSDVCSSDLHIYKKKMKPKQVPLDKELKKIKLREPIKTISGISTKEMAERWEAYYPSVAKKEAAAKKKQKETLAKK